MKTPIPSSQKTTNLLLLVCVIALISSCQKDKPQPAPQQEKSLIGDWYTPMKADKTEQHIHFFADSTIGVRKINAGNDATADTVYNGRFKTQGDSLKISITERWISKQGNPVTKEPSDFIFFPKVSYKIVNQSLTFSYSTSAGAPGKVTFLKLLPLM